MDYQKLWDWLNIANKLSSSDKKDLSLKLFRELSLRCVKEFNNAKDKISNLKENLEKLEQKVKDYEHKIAYLQEKLEETDQSRKDQISHLREGLKKIKTHRVILLVFFLCFVFISGLSLIIGWSQPISNVILPPPPTSVPAPTASCASLEIIELGILSTDTRQRIGTIEKNTTFHSSLEATLLHPITTPASSKLNCQYEWLALYAGNAKNNEVRFRDKEFIIEEEWLLFKETSCQFVLIVSSFDEDIDKLGNPVFFVIELNECPY